VEINPFTEDKGKGKQQEEESGKVEAGAIRMAIAQGINLVCLQLLSLVFGISQFSIDSAAIEESSMERKDLVVKCTLNIGNRLIDMEA
jgi:hypothetical protein